LRRTQLGQIIAQQVLRPHQQIFHLPGYNLYVITLILHAAATNAFIVLTPWLKVPYLLEVGWEQVWIDEVIAILRQEFQANYAKLAEDKGKDGGTDTDVDHLTTTTTFPAALTFPVCDTDILIIYQLMWSFIRQVSLTPTPTVYLIASPRSTCSSPRPLLTRLPSIWLLVSKISESTTASSGG
jgi:hypothetical protein